MRSLWMIGFFAGVRLWACSCAVSPTGTPPCQSAWKFDAVFTGTVVDITDPQLPTFRPRDENKPVEFPRRKVQIRITESLAGLSSDQKEIVIETGMGGGDCGFGFQRGFDYMVYASKMPSGALSTSICSPTRPLEKAVEDLKYFHQLAKAPPVAELRVTAFDPFGDRIRGDGVPPALPGLAGVTVTIEGPSGRQSSITDASGRHVFNDLPPGEYRIDASLEGYAKPENIRSIRVPAKGCAEIPVAMALDRSITGQVLGADGLPEAGLAIEAVPFRPRAENDLPFAADSSTTDANGQYKLRHLRTGDYYVGISLSHPPNDKYPYTRWFVPGTEDPARAVIVHVSDRPESQVFNLTAPLPERGRIIQGLVLRLDGSPAANVNIFLEDPRWSWQSFNVSARTDAQGRFVVHALENTRYRIHAFAPPVSAEPVTVQPGAEPINIRLALTRTGSSLRDELGDGLEAWRKGLGLR